MSFLGYYFNLVEGTGEHQKCCPFPHELSNGDTYLENRPSAHVNTTNHTFHCKACGRGYSDVQFMQAITDCVPETSYKLMDLFGRELPSRVEWENSTKLEEDSHEKALSLGISEEVIQELSIKTPKGEPGLLAFPVFAYDHIVDVRRYNPGGNPKIRSMEGATNGMIIPFDIWVNSPPNKPTMICAGEKDMAIARTHGFNAITLTGGESALPKFFSYFKGKRIIICYDNDEVGRKGGKKLATALHPYADQIKVVTNFHEVCKEKGEDITDFFMKYGKTRDDLVKYIKDTPLFEPEPEIPKEIIQKNTVDLYDASQNYVNKIANSNIQVVAVAETAFRVPSHIIGVKKTESQGEDNNMKLGDMVEWQLNPKNCEQILHLMDSNLKEAQIKDSIRKILLKKPAERSLDLITKSEQTVYKVVVTDMYETADKDVQPMEYTAYSIGHKLESGKKYNITYKLAPHPLKGQQLTMIIVDAKQASDSLNSFVLDTNTIQSLKTIQNLEDTLEKKINTLIEMDKAFIGYNGINDLILMIELSFNTPLRFNFGRIKGIRGYLDTLIIGESRTGKSSTADALRKLYGLGTFTSLAGNSATIAGLIGGSSKGPSGGMQTRAGVIPQNHNGLIIFEEFGKSNKDVLRELTDIRSSNEVRISRVSGTTILPAMVRMIALTNVKTTGEIKSIASYPNGISIITELVNTAEDIARYDLIQILPDTGQTEIDPLWEPLKPLDEKCYRDRIRWVWTRTEEQIYKSKELETYIVEKANELNKKYPSHIKLFGPEAYKKISRVAQAIAALVVSASEDYEKIVVLQEHVDYAINLMIRLYDNPTFKFKEYVEMEQRYKTTDKEAVAALQAIYNKYPSLVLQFEQQAEITKSMLESTTGLDPQDIRRGLQDLTKCYFIKVDSQAIRPTERFRLTVTQINKKSIIGKVGECDVTV